MARHKLEEDHRPSTMLLDVSLGQQMAKRSRFLHWYAMVDLNDEDDVQVDNDDDDEKK